MSDQRVCCQCILSKQCLEAERCLPFTQTTQVEILCIDIKLLKIFSETITYIVYTPKFGTTVVFDFSWDDCIKRWKNWKQWLWKIGGGGQTRCIIMVSVKMVNKISRSLRTNCYKLYPNRLNRLNRVQKLLRLKSSLKNDTNNRNVQFSQVNCKLDRCSTLSKSFWHFKEQEEIKSRA